MTTKPWLTTEPGTRVEWVIDVFKGYAIEYLICTDPDGTQYTPIVPT